MDGAQKTDSILGSGPGRTLRILVVENHPDTRDGIQRFLRGLGHHVAAAGSKVEALALAAQRPCDVLLSDLSLPDGNGWELLQALTEQGQRPRYAVAMSGLDTAADHQRSRQAGFLQHLVKPLRPDKLAAILEKIEAEAGNKVLEVARELTAMSPGWRQRLHDGLCQQLAASALLQAALVMRLEKTAADGPVGSTAGALSEIVAQARQVETTLHAALDELRAFMREEASRESEGT